MTDLIPVPHAGNAVAILRCGHTWTPRRGPWYRRRTTWYRRLLEDSTLVSCMQCPGPAGANRRALTDVIVRKSWLT